VIILDTNVLSEPLRARPNQAVLGWLAAIVENTVLTSVSVGEILTGARRLPPGRRREGLMVAIETTLTTFADQVLTYDESAARCYAQLQELRRAAGHPLSVEDGMIAAICRVRGATLATRNTRDFEGLGVELLNPWMMTN
jgi:predicted nucleic acid-binding protein